MLLDFPTFPGNTMRIAAIVVLTMLQFESAQWSSHLANTSPPPAASGDCIARHDATTRKCGNLLPPGWQKFTSPKDFDSLKLRLYELPEVTAYTSVTRTTDVGCRKAPGKPDLTADVVLQRPVAMDSFPAAGTNRNDLLVAVLDVWRDEGCPEDRYGVLRKRSGSQRVFEFITVQTEPVVDSVKQDRIIGRWSSWTIVMKGGSRDASYEITRRKSGDYYQCYHTHDERYGAVAFMSCEASRLVAKMARPARENGPLFVSLLQRIMRGDANLAREVNAVPSTDPAWGRCGSLGCCAAGK